MSEEFGTERRLAAVLAADVAGFSRLTEADEVGTLRMLATQRTILDSAISKHRGRIANTAGDSVLAEFPSAVNAVQCAVEAQQALREAAEVVEPADRRVLFRIGIHVGDVMVRDGDLLGNGVNVAARLEALADAGGIVLSAATHEQVKKILPLAYTDLGAQSVKNIEEPVRAFAIGQASAASTVADLGKPLPLPDKPSIAVLPFQNMSGDPEQEYFADGMVEDIITALSRFKSLFVIARNSSFTYKGKAIDIKQVGRELGVRYVLEGSVRKSGNRLRVTAQLVEAASQAHLWADKFDRLLTDVFELQDQITSAVVQQINPRIEQSEIERASRKPAANLDSYDCFLRGIALIRKYQFDSSTREFFRAAYTLDPNYADAYATDAFVLMNQQVTFGRLLSVDERKEAIHLARTASELANDDASALAHAAHVLSYFAADYDRATALVDKAVALNPNSYVVWHARGWIALICGDPERTIESFEQSLRLSPRDRAVASYWMGTAYALAQLGRYEEGFLLAQRAVSFACTTLALMALIFNAVPTGRHDEAREAARRLLKAAPDFRVADLRTRWPNRNADRLSHEAEYLRLAGVPE